MLSESAPVPMEPEIPRSVLNPASVPQFALENMLDGFVALTRDWIYTYVNAPAERLLQTPRENLLNRSLWECFPDLGNTSLCPQLRHAMEHQTAVEQEEYNARLNRWFEVRAVGAPDGMAIYFRDITSRRNREIALRSAAASVRSSENRFRALTEHSTDIVTALTTEGTMLYASNSMTRMLGYESKEVVGTSCFDMIHPADTRRVRAAMREVFSGNPNSDRIRFRFQHKKGAWRWLESTATLQSSQPDLGQFVVNSRDITDRIQAEEETRRNLVLLQAVTEGTPDIVFVKDRDGHFLMINSVGARFLGASVEDIVGKECSVFFEPELARILRKSEQEVFDTERTQTCEEALTYRGETRNFLSVRAPYRDGKGEVIGMIGIMRDISEQKALQEQLMRSERLAAMGELVAGVAHELNNPLAAISGFAQLLQQHPDLQVQADAMGIYQMTDRAARIVRSLLAFARQTDRRERRPESLRVIVEETLEMMRYRFRDSGVDVALDLAEPDVFPYVNAGQIEQVLLNLFSNAEFALRQQPEERRITVMTRRVKRSGRQWALLSVSDNGTGIPYEVQGRIFDPFFTTKQLGDGTGLGLSICHGLIAEHGGTITVQSKPNEGATFFILLPLMES